MNKISLEITQPSLWLLYIGCHPQFRLIYSPWLPFGKSGSQIFTVSLTSRSHKQFRSFFTIVPWFPLPWCWPATHLTQIILHYCQFLYDMCWVNPRLGKFHWRVFSSTSGFPSTAYHKYTHQFMQIVYHSALSILAPFLILWTNDGYLCPDLVAFVCWWLVSMSAACYYFL